MRLVLSSLAVALLPFICNGLTLKRDDRACNNSPNLCSKPYDTITYLGSHDAPYLRDDSTFYSSFGNQFFKTSTQLDAGVRLLSGQIHVASNPQTDKRELHLCHTSCFLFDAGPLKDWLIEVRTWMDAHPHDVVTLLLVNMDNVDAREIEGVYSEADIAHYGYIPHDITKAPPQSNETHPTWPTLNDLIDSDKRLLSFFNPIKPDKENAPYLLNEFDFLWENNYEVISPTGFNCTPHRPDAKATVTDMQKSGRLFMMNHMLYWQQGMGIQVPDIRYVNETNAWDGVGGLGTHMIECGNQLARLPTFVLVDFFNVASAIKSVDNFNKVKTPVGRISITDQVVGGGAGIMRLSGGTMGRPPAIVVLIALVATTALLMME